MKLGKGVSELSKSRDCHATFLSHHYHSPLQQSSRKSGQTFSTVVFFCFLILLQFLASRYFFMNYQFLVMTLSRINLSHILLLLHCHIMLDPFLLRAFCSHL